MSKLEGQKCTVTMIDQETGKLRVLKDAEIKEVIGGEIYPADVRESERHSWSVKAKSIFHSRMTRKMRKDFRKVFVCHRVPKYVSKAIWADNIIRVAKHQFNETHDYAELMKHTSRELRTMFTRLYVRMVFRTAATSTPLCQDYLCGGIVPIHNIADNINTGEMVVTTEEANKLADHVKQD